ASCDATFRSDIFRRASDLACLVGLSRGATGEVTGCAAWTNRAFWSSCRCRNWNRLTALFPDFAEGPNQANFYPSPKPREFYSGTDLGSPLLASALRCGC